MRPFGVGPDDPQLRVLVDTTPLQQLTESQRRRIKFWAWMADHAERQWLLANGWLERGRGWWFLPDWHPKKTPSKKSKRRDRPDELLEPYDQSHAANSQRFYIRTVQTPRTLRRISSTDRERLFFRVQVVAGGLANVCAGLGGGIYRHQGLNWLSSLFFLAAVLTLCVSLRAARAWRLELVLNHAEERLRSGKRVEHSD